jgi:hypothetical protein
MRAVHSTQSSAARGACRLAGAAARPRRGRSRPVLAAQGPRAVRVGAMVRVLPRGAVAAGALVAADSIITRRDAAVRTRYAIPVPARARPAARCATVLEPPRSRAPYSASSAGACGRRADRARHRARGDAVAIVCDNTRRDSAPSSAVPLGASWRHRRAPSSARTTRGRWVPARLPRPPVGAATAPAAGCPGRPRRVHLAVHAAAPRIRPCGWHGRRRLDDTHVEGAVAA